MTPRRLLALIALACAGLLGYGYYLEYVRHLEPCPLCMLQRLCFMASGAVALLGAMHGAGATGTRVYAALLGLAAGAGAATAGRQIWLQQLPADQVPECGPGLEFMVEMHGWSETLARVLRGTGDCAVVDWTFLGLSIAGWSLLWFAAFLLAAGYLLVRPRPPRDWRTVP